MSTISSTVFDFSTQVLRLVNGVREAEGRGMESLLDYRGLQRQRGPLVPALWFAAGAAAAGAAVLLMTPTSGKKVRQGIASLVAGGVENVTAGVKAVEQQIERAVRVEAPAIAHAPNGSEPGKA